MAKNEHTAENDAWRETIATACDRLPCFLLRGHEGPCEPGSRSDPRRVGNDAPPKPLLSLNPAPPVAKVRRSGSRERGWMAWEAWVSCGMTCFAGENGTYAWTRKGAERKARRLLRKYEARRSGPEITVATRVIPPGKGEAL